MWMFKEWLARMCRFTYWLWTTDGFRYDIHHKDTDIRNMWRTNRDTRQKMSNLRKLYVSFVPERHFCGVSQKVTLFAQWPKEDSKKKYTGGFSWGVWGRSWQKTLSFSIRQEFKVIHVTLLMYLAWLVFIPYLYKKIEMNGWMSWIF
jgi:hypothetical protein